MLRKFLLTASVASLCFAALTAFAGPTDDAKLHFQAIGSGDMAMLMRAYADSAQFNWIDGPFGYAISGSADNATLARISAAVYDQLQTR